MVLVGSEWQHTFEQGVSRLLSCYDHTRGLITQGSELTKTDRFNERSSDPNPKKMALV